MEQYPVRNALHAHLKEKKSQLSQQLQDIQDARNNETKSSAGDKYETTREMMQQEADQIEARLQQTTFMIDQLHHLPSPEKDVPVQVGHLIKTNLGWFFLSVPFGKFSVEGMICFALSPSSPLGQKLLGGQVDDTITLGRITYRIEAVK